MANGGKFHIAAVLRRGKTFFAPRANQKRTHPAANHLKESGHTCHSIHAEHSALNRARPGDTLYVIRFLANGLLGMAKPCTECQKKLKARGITRVYYTNELGEWCKL
jgi:deoxycytidylate deaminase